MNNNNNKKKHCFYKTQNNLYTRISELNLAVRFDLRTCGEHLNFSNKNFLVFKLCRDINYSYPILPMYIIYTVP